MLEDYPHKPQKQYSKKEHKSEKYLESFRNIFFIGICPHFSRKGAASIPYLGLHLQAVVHSFYTVLLDRVIFVIYRNRKYFLFNHYASITLFNMLGNLSQPYIFPYL